jgi:hypothetical protein
MKPFPNQVDRLPLDRLKPRLPALSELAKYNRYDSATWNPDWVSLAGHRLPEDDLDLTPEEQADLDEMERMDRGVEPEPEDEDAGGSEYWPDDYEDDEDYDPDLDEG